MAEYPSLESLVSSLSGKRVGNHWMACCPAHKDATPSLSVSRGQNGLPVVHCHAGCAQSAVLAALCKRGLWPEAEPKPTGKRANGNGANGHGNWMAYLPPPADAPRPTTAMLRCDTLHEYFGPDDELLFYVRRHEGRAGHRKQFVPLTYGWLDSKLGWQSKAPDAPRPLYGLNRLSHAAPDATVLLCEGEKSADAAQRMFPDHVGMAWCGGAAAVDTADLSPLASRSVVIWPDADTAGAKAARDIARHLPRAATLRTDGLAAGYDAADLEMDPLADPLVWLEQRLPPKPETFEATPFDWDEMLAVPPRNWVYGHFLIRRFISVLGAPGGSGKTAYAFVIAAAIACNDSFLGERIHEPGNVWIYNLEDPKDELLRRFWAAVQRHKIRREQLEGRLFIDSGRSRPLCIATITRDGAMVASPIVQDVVAEIKRRNIKVMIVDPFIRSHRLEENINEQMDFAAELWGMVAEQADCAVLLVHHFRKGGSGGEAASFRGASALVDAARAALSISVMNEEEADKLGVAAEQRWQYVRVDNAKLNLAPPPENTVWLKLIGETLDNATSDKPADVVQSVERWEPAGPWDGLPWSTIVRVLEKIDAGTGDGEFYAFAPQAHDRWAGQVLIDQAGKTFAQAKSILKDWKQNGVLDEGNYHSPARRRVIACVRVNQAKFSEMRQVNSSQFASDD